MIFLVVCIFLVNLSSQLFVDSSSILFFHLIATSSHRISIWPLAEKLADKGHHVTYIFPMENPPHHHPKIEELVPSKMVPILRDYVGEFDINFRLNNTVDQWTSKLFSTCLQLCEHFYDSPEIQEWLQRPGLHYDLIMIDALPGDCAYGLVHRFKAKHVLFTPVIPHYIWDGAVGNLPESCIPESYFNYKPTEMTLLSRILGTYAIISWRLDFVNFLSHVESVIKNKLNVANLPSLKDFERNTSLVLVNSHFIDDYPLALPPIVQSYSGLWCSQEKLQKGGKPLPKDISEFLENKNVEGFVYVSFGSSVVVSTLPSDVRNIFFRAFNAFPKLKFLWKWTGARPDDTPKNVMLRPWYPQRDILAHTKVKGFITQAGRPSLQEALCYGVAMITFPIYADQDYNANRLEFLGASINLDIGNISQTALQNAINAIVYSSHSPGSSNYKARLMELSEKFRDRPIDPLENAIYWTEYVLRHNDTTVLKSLGSEQTWYQRRLLDVYGAVASMVFILGGVFVVIMFSILKCVAVCCFLLQKKKIE